MPQLVALDASPSTDFVDALRRAWDVGDAVLPVDPRLPAPARARLLDALAVGGEVDEGDALVLATSGTTGEPKGAVLTHAALAASASATSARLGVDPERDTWLACLPLAHAGGLGVVVRALLTGAGLVVRPEFAATADSGATLVSIVRTHLARSRPEVAGYRVALLGGGSPPPDVPANVVTTYGMTETGGGVVYDGQPLDDVELRAVDGQLFVRGPMLLRAYRDGSAAFDGDGWFATGDGGTVDADGRVRVSGRLADVIVTGGEKVWPDPVETILRSMPGVAEVAVVGRPDPEWGEAVVAVVELAPGASPPSLEVARALVRESMPAWCAPKEIIIKPKLPRTALGKVRRGEVRSTP